MTKTQNFDKSIQEYLDFCNAEGLIPGRYYSLAFFNQKKS